MTDKPIYKPTIARTKGEIRDLLESGDISDQADAIWSATCTVNDYKWAQDICHEYSESDNPILRRGAILGLSNVARTFGKLDKTLAKPLLLRALDDADEGVVDAARCAIEDVNHFFRWSIGKRRQANKAIQRTALRAATDL